MTDTVAALERVPLFAGLKRRELQKLAESLKERTFPAGDAITTEGEAGLGFFVIAEGRATVDVGGQERTSLGPGDSFGEIALLDEGPRTATVRAETELRTFGMTPWVFKPFLESHPEVAWILLQTLARRLREAG
jgi:CRP/FNR family transcriptional regulator